MDGEHAARLTGDGASNQLAAQRTVMAFERTGLATDRTLMAVTRTSLSLIGFGFTIFQFFHKLKDQLLEGVMAAEAPRRMGLALISIGIVLLVMGIVSHLKSTRQHNDRRERLLELGLVRAEPAVRLSPAMISAILLLVVGLSAVANVAFRIGPL